MVLDDLLEHRLVILSGKGGVGKSVVGTALALAARARGKRILFIEVDAPLPASRYLGEAPVGGRETEVRPGFSMVNLVPAQVMDEYVREMVRVDMLSRKVLASPIYRRFFAAAPGLPELMVMGKIMVLEEERTGWPRRPKYDLIVVDAPATGHGLAFLKVPLAASNAVPVGPVGYNARKILSMLRDRKRTALAIVAVPEEMAVVEALEFHRMTRDELGIETSAFILNGCHERRFTGEQETEILRRVAGDEDGRLAPGVTLQAALAAGRRHIRRRKLTQFYRRRLEQAVDAPVVSLPLLFTDRVDETALQTLAQRLEAA
ncbi:MAG TPA: ArsA-related P-loop ATPase [Vicinamibacteria bacterium]|nr:ArsA-related P-loop ATPase [Vicinamibacteria bacterium]